MESTLFHLLDGEPVQVTIERIESSEMIAAAFAGYAFGIAWAFARVVLRNPPWRKSNG